MANFIAKIKLRLLRLEEDVEVKCFIMIGSWALGSKVPQRHHGRENWVSSLVSLIIYIPQTVSLRLIKSLQVKKLLIN